MSSLPPDTVPPQLARLPEGVRAAYRRVLADPTDTAALDIVIDAVLLDLMPKRNTATPVLREESRMIEDLGYDSLAVAELIFLLEDAFKVSVSNEEIFALKTVAELRLFMRNKLKTS